MSHYGVTKNHSSTDPIGRTEIMVGDNFFEAFLGIKVSAAKFQKLGALRAQRRDLDPGPKFHKWTTFGWCQ